MAYWVSKLNMLPFGSGLVNSKSILFTGFFITRKNSFMVFLLLATMSGQAYQHTPRTALTYKLLCLVFVFLSPLKVFLVQCYTGDMPEHPLAVYYNIQYLCVVYCNSNRAIYFCHCYVYQTC